MDEFDDLIKRSLDEVSKEYRGDIEKRRPANRARLVARKDRWLVPRIAVAVAAIAGLIVAGASILPRLGTDSPDTVSSNEPGDRWVATVFDIDAPTDLGVKPGHLWVTSQNGKLMKVDASTGEVLVSLDLGGAGDDIEIDGRDIWVAVPELGAVVRADARSGTVIETISIGEPATEVNLSAGPFRVWAVIPGRNIVQIDRSTSAAVVLDLGGGPVDIAARGDGVWLLDTETGLSRLDPETGAIANE